MINNIQKFVKICLLEQRLDVCKLEQGTAHTQKVIVRYSDLVLALHCVAESVGYMIMYTMYTLFLLLLDL